MIERCAISCELCHIKRAINIYDSESALNYLDVNDQVSVYNSTIMNIVTIFIPNETKTRPSLDE